MKILIVEDEPELVQSIISVFKRGKLYVRNSNYILKRRWEKIERFDYDCILLGYYVPDGSGLALLEQLKKDNKTDGVIIISAKNAIDDRIKGLNLGADDYLAKPFHLSELSARVAAVIRRRRF